MLKLKNNSVAIGGLQNKMYFALGIADAAFAEEGLECVVTAGTDGDHNPGSLHPIGAAVDLRNSNCSPDQRQRIMVKLMRLNKYGFDVIDEAAGQTVKTTATHFHLEFQPKPGEQFWHLESQG